MLLVSFTSLFAADRISNHTTVKGKHISVTYGQPSKKGRVIFGGLVPYGKVWRTGADEATEITVDKDIMFGGKKLAAGTYSLYTIPNKTEWTIIINPVLKQWGAFEYDKVKDKDVLRTTVPVKNTGKEVETFTILVKDDGQADDGLVMEWDKVQVKVPVKI
jgi:hypothetical protein